MQGNTATDSARIIRTFEVVPGGRFSEDAIRRGIRKLFALGLFDDVWVERLPHGDRVDLVIHVGERPRISKIEFSGNKKRENSELERKLHIHQGSVYSPTSVQVEVDSLLKFYRDEGFAQATIHAATDSASAGNQVALRFVIHEGERVKISKIQFEGITAFPETKLRKQLKSKKRGFMGGGDIKEESFAEDKEKLEAWYHNHGYRDMRYLGQELVPGDTPRHLTLVVRVDEGQPYWMGDVSWSGEKVVDGATLTKQWAVKRGDRYDASRIDKAQAGAYAEYQERGYLELNIEPRESVRGDTVDVAFAIQEGRPSDIRFINIVGNKGTREKVIRREMAIHEGDRFKRSALVRTQGDIFRLGIFEDVQIEPSPAESTAVDIILKVKEKQVGTASAGAGYTSESGLTGFLELGHNNVLGNGQSLSLHLERGGRRSDYYLSFTEPWFRDTPTLLGFSAFNTSRDQDAGDDGSDYAEKRVGASIRVGRPLPWPDYSRGSLSYRLENVSISIDKADGVPLDARDSLLLAGLRNGEGVLTSSLQGVLSRTSTDNPFYPTKGSKLTLDHELAGGPFGGRVNFHKHRIEGRSYQRSLVKGLTSMFRARIGMLGEYGDQSTPVPAYERFRLGGGSTLDPLRGYDDYEVVPSKFIRSVANYVKVIDRIASTDSNTVYRDSLSFYSALRYPGGRFALTYSVEQQFPIVHPLHAVLFFDAGNTWDSWKEIRPWDLKLGLGAGLRFEIPLLGNVGFDYGYGFQHQDFDSKTGQFSKHPRFKSHFLLGNVNF